MLRCPCFIMFKVDGKAAPDLIQKCEHCWPAHVNESEDDH